MSSLAVRLKTQTGDVHRQAERSRFMAALLRGDVDRAGYCAYLRSLHAIYVALESVLARHSAHPLIRPVFDPSLFRGEALADDLRTLHGESWTDELVPQPAALCYAARLEQIAGTNPGRLLAHAYVRYLGDLSGGQVLRRIVAQATRLPGGLGTRFYWFGDEARTRALTLAFRAGLDAITPDPSQSDEIVDEALLAFGLHEGLFDALAEVCGLADPPSRAGPPASD